jgi:molecular chaperone DnaJ
MTATTDWLEKDYYQLLGVPQTAGDKEITNAYRRLARQLHPDKNADSDAAERFQEVAAAYDVLHDENKRREYDELRRLAAQPRRPSAGGTAGWDAPGGYTIRVDHVGDPGGFAGVDMDDLLGSMFGGQRRSTPRSTPRPRRGDDLAADLWLSFDEAVRGTTTRVTVDDEVLCGRCDGAGGEPGTRHAACTACGGQGTERISSSVSARIPAGVDDGQTIRLKGKGRPGRNGGPAGDLLVRLHVSGHRLFGRSGRNLTLTVPVTFAEAALGADITVPTLDEPVTVRIPPGTPTGKTFRVRGLGVATGKGSGDLLVTVEVSVPRHLTAEQRAAVEALARATTQSPRADLGV